MKLTYFYFVCIHRCGVVGFPEGCKLGEEDLSKPYPDCCPGVEC